MLLDNQGGEGIVSNEEKIQALIQQTDDPVQRATLMVLQKMDAAMENQIEVTTSIADSLKEHREDMSKRILNEALLLSAFKGAWWAGVLFIGALQVVGGFIVSRAVASNDEQDKRLGVLEKEFAVLNRSVQEHHESFNGRPTVGR